MVSRPPIAIGEVMLFRGSEFAERIAEYLRLETKLFAMKVEFGGLLMKCGICSNILLNSLMHDGLLVCLLPFFRDVSACLRSGLCDMIF